MKHARLFISLIMIFGLGATPVWAAEQSSTGLPWKKGYLNAGIYFVSLNSSFRLGESNLGVGLELDVEDFLDLDTSDSAFRIDAGWRFGETLKHKVEFSWFSFDRDGTKNFETAVDIPAELQPPQTIGPGEVNSFFDFDIYKLKYEYSFIFDERIDLNAGLGLYIVPIEFGISGVVDSVGQAATQEDITAPLPVLGLGFDFAITPQWILRQQLDLFYLEIGDFQGSITDFHVGLEYLPWEHVGLGLAANALRVHVEAEGSDYPGVDFIGEVDFNYFGLLLYLKFFL